MQINSYIVQPSFNPSLYGPLWAWYKRSSLMTIVGGKISAWGDSSGNGRTMSQSTPANQPTNVSGTAWFDGVNDALVTQVTEVCPASYTLLTLVKTNNVGYICGFSGAGTNTSMYLAVGLNLTYDVFTFHGHTAGSTLSQTTSNVQNTGSYIVLATKYTAGQIPAYIYRNGIKQPSTDTGVTTVATATGTFRIGLTANCEVVETIIYSSALADSDIQTVSNYLLTKMTYPLLGTIYASQFLMPSQFSGWTANFPANFTTGLSGLTVANISGGQTGKATYNYVTDVENWEITGNFVVGTIDATSFGIGIGIDTAFTVGQGMDFYSTIRLDSGNLGRVYHENSQASFNDSGANQLAIIPGDTIFFSIIRDKDLYISRYWTNASNQVILTKAMTYSGFNASLGCAAVSKPVIRSLGGSHLLQNYVFKSTARKYANYLFKGDSITAGYLMQYAGYRWQNQDIADTTRFTVLGGAQEKTADALLSVAEIVRLEPSTVVILIGINDFYNGVLLATSISNIQSMVNGIKAGLPTVSIYLCKLLPCNDFDVTTFNSTLVTTFTGQVTGFIDFYTLMVGSGTNINATYSSDGLHPNAVGATVMAGILNSAGIN